MYKTNTRPLFTWILTGFFLLVQPVLADSFWAFPENPEQMNRGRLKVTYYPLSMSVRADGEKFGPQEDYRFQILDNDLIRIKASPAQLNSRSDIDFSKFPGYDFVLTEGYYGDKYSDGMPRYHQVFFHIPDNGHSDLPAFFVNRPKGVNFNFWKSFPEFTLPKGKIFDLFTSSYDSQTGQIADYSRHGWTGLRPEAGGKGSNTAIFDYDDWARSEFFKSYNLAQYLADPKLASLWLIAYPIESLRQLFLNGVQGLGGHPLGEALRRIYLDFEFWGLWEHESGFWDIFTDLILTTRTQQPQTQIMVWGAKPYRTSYHERIDSTNADRKWSENTARITGRDLDLSLDQLVKDKKIDNWALTSILPHLGSIEALGYMNNISENASYHLIHEIEVERKLFPSKKIVPVFWYWVEILSEKPWGLSEHFLKTESGSLRKVAIKPIVPPSVLHSVTAWSLFLADGMGMWSDPLPLGDDETHYAMGEPFGTAPLGPKNSQYPSHTTRGLDWSALAAYQLSQELPKSIIEADTRIQEVEFSVDGGRNWHSGDDLRPPMAEVRQLPVIRAKPSKEGDHWLVLGVDRNGPLSVRDVWIRIQGKTARIQLKGFFTTIQTFQNQCNGIAVGPSGDPSTRCLVERNRTEPPITVKLYPNPIENGLVKADLEIPDPIQGLAFKALIYDQSGRQILQFDDTTRGSTTRFEIPFERMAPGVYWLRIQLANEVKTVKFVKID